MPGLDIFATDTSEPLINAVLNFEYEILFDACALEFETPVVDFGIDEITSSGTEQAAL